MRLCQCPPFFAHLKDSFPDALAPCYLVLAADPVDRIYLAQKILSFCKKRGAPQFVPPFDEGEVLDALTPQFFTESQPCALLQNVDKADKKGWRALLGKAMGSGLLLLTGSGKVEGVEEIEKRGVILDLSQEKPWEKRDRIFFFLLEKLRREKKEISPEALSFLHERMGDNLFALEQEIDKLLCYIGAREKIEKGDLFLIGAKREEDDAWQIAEEWVWGERRDRLPSKELFSPFLSALRYQFMLGRKIGSLLEERVPQKEWGKFLPKIWPKTLEKRIGAVQAKGSAFFERGARAVLEAEEISRAGGASEENVCAYLFGKVHHG